ncbi:hypothetical protein ACIRUL_02095 [Streptomyces sp. NPDC101171]|uniref:hypothetical protein n=1 Tax=Streptomyces sp. NPDC101171 TaxID=3366122 RepID=UPI00382AA909
MADERCVSPGDDPRAPDEWLTGETAERLLRGESPASFDPAVRDQAERLAEVLGALSVPASAASAELRGEEAALAAFRKAREAAEAERTAAAFGDGAPGGEAAPVAAGAGEGLVRIGAPARSGSRSRRPRWARPVRLTLAAAMAAGTLGGVAVAAGSGVLPMPFHKDRPAPAASVSADETHGRPRVSPSAPAPQGPGAGTRTPGAGPGASAGGAPSGGATTGADSGGTPGGTTGNWWRDAATACRDIRNGKSLGAGRKRALEGMAGGAARVGRYCDAVLAAKPGAGGDDNAGDDSGDGSGKGESDGKGKGDGKNKGGGKGGTGQGDENGQGGDEDGQGGNGDGRGHGRHGGGRQRGAAASPSPSDRTNLAPGRRGAAPVPSPSPTYSAL